MTVAFFDLDKTLLAVNSGALWVKRERALGFLSAWQAARAAVWLGRYHLGLAAAEEMIEIAVAQLTGQPEAPVAARTQAFFEATVRREYRIGGLRALASHRARGDRVVLLTSSSNYLAGHVAAELGLDGVLCNTLDVAADGTFTGKVRGGVCFGRGKLVHATDYAARAHVRLADCAFYTDSYSDLAVLEAVGRPVAVNPDPRLLRHARRLGWPVEDWGPGTSLGAGAGERLER